MNIIKKLSVLSAIIIVSSLFLLPQGTRGLPQTVEEAVNDEVAKQIDAASFQQVKLLDSMVDFPRPAKEVSTNLEALVKKYPSEPGYLKALAEAQVVNGEYDAAAASMEKLAAIHPDKKAGLRQLSSFYASRVEPEKQMASLQRLADLLEGKEKIAALKEILAVNDNHLLKKLDKESVLRQIITIEPDNADSYKALIQELKEKEKFTEALKETEGALVKFPDMKNSFLALKADVLLKLDRGDDALALFDTELNIAEDLPVIRSYLGLLDKMDMRKAVTRELQRKHRLNTLSKKEFQKYFLILRHNRSSQQVWKLAEQYIANNKPLGFGDQLLLAKALRANGNNTKAWQLLYGSFLKAPEENKEEANALLVSWSADLGRYKSNLSGSSSEMLFNNLNFDTRPGISGGLLSLLFNKQDLPWRFSDLSGASKNYEGARIHYSLFQDFIKKYPESEYVPLLYRDIIRSLNSYSRHNEAVLYAEAFMNRYVNNESYYLVAEAAVESFKQLKQSNRIEKLYKELLARAKSRKEEDNYKNYLSKMEQFYTTSRQLPKVITLYWQEITANPDDENLYARFLRFLTRYKIYDEELKVYKQAVARFNTNSYYDKMARWYIRAKQKNKFQELTKKISDIFSDSELKEYFRDHLRTGGTKRGAMQADTVFYRTMYEYANKRFPRNLFFVDRLLDHYYTYDLWQKYEAMAKKYFYISSDIRTAFLGYLSKESRLEGALASMVSGGDLSRSILQKAMSQAAPKNLAEALVVKYAAENNDKTPEPKANASAAEKLFLAEAAGWNSYYEASLPVYSGLIKEFPQMVELREHTASLYRSMGQRTSSQESYEALAQQLPNNKKYPTLAGEVAMESGDFNAAFANWKNIITSAPAVADRYLEVATILWDYYRFEESAAVIEQGRKALADPGLYGQKLAAVYESAKDYTRAIDEYILTVVRNYDQYYERYGSEERLRYLATRRGMQELVINRYKALMQADGKNGNFVKALYDFLDNLEEDEEKVLLLQNSLSLYQDREFINWLADQFRDLKEAEFEGKCYQRLISLDGENTENLYHLALYRERQQQLDQADAILVKRMNMTATDQPEAMGDYIATIEEAASFSWKHDRFDQAFQRYEKAARLKTGYQLKSSLHELAKKLVYKEKYTKATAILQELLKLDPLSSGYFDTLAGIYTSKDDYAGLIELFRDRLEVVQKSPQLSKDDRKYRTNMLRTRLVTNLEKLGDFTNALDQYIEMINSDYSNATYLDNAYLIASNHDLTDRLMNYYLKTSEKSFKDHRWNYILARLYQLQNKIPLAIEQWQKAIVNEPQRVDLRENLAENLISQKSYQEAVKQYLEIYRLDQKNTFWLRHVASVQAMSGDMTAARATLDKMVQESAKNYDVYFLVAEYLTDWGDNDLALTRMQEGLEVLKKDIYENRLSQKRLNQYVQAVVQQDLVVEGFDALLNLNRVYTAEANKKMNSRAWIARQGQNLTYQVFADSFAKAARNFASDAKLQAMKTRLASYLDPNIVKYNSNSNDSAAASTIRWVRDVALEMGYADLAIKAISQGLDERYGDGYYSRSDKSLLAYYRNRFNWEDAYSTSLEEIQRLDDEERDGEIYQAQRLVHTFKPEDELAFMQKHFSLFYNRYGASDKFTLRLIELLEAKGDKQSIDLVVSSYQDGRLALTNYFMKKGETDLAIKALETSGNGILWQDSKKLIIGTRHGRNESSLNMSNSSTDMMLNKPIARRLGVDANDAFTGDDYFDFLPHYASYLTKFGTEGEGDPFADGIAEKSARSAFLQKKAGDWYAGHSKWQKAMYHYDLALQLAPANWDVLVAIGDMNLKKGDRQAALASWQKLIPEGVMGDTYQKWMRILWERGFEAEAKAGAVDYLVNKTGKEYTWQDRELLGSFANLMNEQQQPGELISLMKMLASAKNKPFEFILPFYQEVSDMPEVKLAAVAELIRIQKSQPDSGNAYKEWLEEGIVFSADHKQFNASTLKWCKEYEASGFHEKPNYRIGSKRDYFWIKGKVLSASGNGQEAEAAMKLYLDAGNYGDQERVDKIYKVLKADGHAAIAVDLAVDFYKEKVAQGSSGSDIFFRYADYLVEKGDLPQVKNLLDRAVYDSVEKKEALERAAVILEDSDQRKMALNYRERLRDLAPENESNLLKIAWTMARTGQGGKAAEKMKAVLNEKSGVVLISRWADRYQQVMAGASDVASAELARLKAMTEKTEASALLVFLLHKAAGDEAGAIAFAEKEIDLLVKADSLSQALGETYLSRGDGAKALKYGKISRNTYPSPGNGMLIFNALRKLGKREQMLVLATAQVSWDLYQINLERIDDYTGLEGEKKLAFLQELYGIALELKQAYLAESYLNTINDMARNLGVPPGVDRKGLVLLRKEEAQRDSGFKIVSEIAN